jgi:LDH2 family malate/lactate/ureidoglycolate dehydrogenase
VAAEHTIALATVVDIGTRALVRQGLTADEAEFAVRRAVDAELQGRRGREMAELAHLLHMLQSGEWRAPTPLDICEDSPGGALVDSDGGVPYIVCWHAMRLAIAKAKAAGIAAVGVRRGAVSLGPLLRVAVEEGVVALAFCCGPAVMAPPGGIEPVVGNNPFGIGIPAGDEAPIILDLSWGVSSAAPILQAVREGRPEVRPDVLLDADGNPTTNPRDFIEEGSYEAIPTGSILPIGGHKGYAVATALGALVSCLLDVPPRRYLSQMGYHYGSLFICLDPRLFGTAATLGPAVDAYLRRIVDSPRRPDAPPIRYPGQQRHQRVRAGWASGQITLPDASWAALQELAAALGETLPV